MGSVRKFVVGSWGLACFLCLLAVGAHAQKLGDYVPGELLVKYSPATKTTKSKTANRVVGATVLEELGDLGWQRVRLPATLTIDQAVAKYQRLDGVEFAQPNFYYHLLATPNDPMYPNAGMYGLGKISAPSAWDLSTGIAAVVVADIDTGARYTHEDLAANMWHNPGEIPNNGIDDDGDGIVDDYYGADFRDSDGDPIDPHGHGTHTAGTIGAVGNNSVGVVGVNWNVRIMAVKIYNAAANDTTSAMLINAYNYVRMMKTRAVNPVNIRVTNNSYGGCTEACGFDQATKDAIDAIGDAGIVNVFAAGNSNTNNDTSPSYPVSYSSPSIIGVAASDSTDAKAGFSSYGLNTVDLAALGVGVLSTYNSSDSGYTTLSGTSMATPHVTGAVALLAGYQPGLSVASLKATILNNVDLLANWNGLVKTGGRLNIFKAMQNPTVCTFTPSSNPVNVGPNAGSQSFTVTVPPNCDYMPKTAAPWITVSNSSPLSGNGTVNFTVTQNPSGNGRSATIDLWGTAVTISQSGQPTAAGVSVSGRVLTRDGSGLRGALVTIKDQDGVTRTALTNAFGYYNFDQVPSGPSYLISATAKRYSFSPRTVNLTDSLSGLDFVDGQ